MSPSKPLGRKISDERLYIRFMLFRRKELRFSGSAGAHKPSSSRSAFGNILCLVGISRVTTLNIVQVYNILPRVGSSQPFFSHAHSGNINAFCSCRQPLLPKPTQYKTCLNSSWYTLWHFWSSWLWLQPRLLLLDGGLLDEPENHFTFHYWHYQVLLAHSTMKGV